MPEGLVAGIPGGIRLAVFTPATEDEQVQAAAGRD
jgi:hypothetical protein